MSIEIDDVVPIRVFLGVVVWPHLTVPRYTFVFRLVEEFQLQKLGKELKLELWFFKILYRSGKIVHYNEVFSPQYPRVNCLNDMTDRGKF